MLDMTLKAFSNYDMVYDRIIEEYIRTFGGTLEGDTIRSEEGTITFKRSMAIREKVKYLIQGEATWTKARTDWWKRQEITSIIFEHSASPPASTVSYFSRDAECRIHFDFENDTHSGKLLDIRIYGASWGDICAATFASGFLLWKDAEGLVRWEGDPDKIPFVENPENCAGIDSESYINHMIDKGYVSLTGGRFL